MRKILIYIIFPLLCVGLSACRKKDSESLPQTQTGTEFRQDALLTVSAPNGTLKATYEVEIAATPKTNMQGLMYRESMAENRGMLFDPQGLSDTSFWMKNTYIPLDIIYIDENNQIMNIASGTKPFSTQSISAGGIYRYVLEINAGQTGKHNIIIGDKIEWTKESPEQS